MFKSATMMLFVILSAGPALAQAPAEVAKPVHLPQWPSSSAPSDSLPRLRYLADGLVTLNDRCPVRKVRLNPKMNAAYVNGFPVGFC